MIKGHAMPYRVVNTSLDGPTSAEVERRVRAVGLLRAAQSLHIGRETLLQVIDGGRARPDTIARIKATVLAQHAKAAS